METVLVSATIFASGGEYRDHRENGRHDLRDKEEIIFHPGSAVIVETEESVRLPKTRFACVVPKVELLKKGLSNTMSKVDPGYNGHLLITIFNLGKKTETLRWHDTFCSLCFFQVDGDVNLYRKGEKRIEEGKAGKGWWRSFRDKVERNTALVIIIVPIVSMVCQIIVLVLQNYLEH